MGQRRQNGLSVMGHCMENGIVLSLERSTCKSRRNGFETDEVNVDELFFSARLMVSSSLRLGREPR